MKVYRIAPARFAKTRRDGFSGKGALQVAGRWTSAGRPVVYTSQSLSLAALEILVHLKQTNDIKPFNAFCADIPDEFIQKPASYPAPWQTVTEVSRAVGDEWLSASRLPAFLVPAVVSPGEWNVLLNPLHPLFSLDWIVDGPLPYAFDARLLKRAPTPIEYEATPERPPLCLEEDSAIHNVESGQKKRRQPSPKSHKPQRTKPLS